MSDASKLMARETRPERTFAFRVLGPVSADTGAGEINLGGLKQRAVLALLLSRTGSAVDRDVLIEGVWGEGATDDNRRSLQTYLSNLRSLTGLSLSRSGSAYTLQYDRGQIDQFAFEESIDLASRQLTTAPEQAIAILKTGLGWWRGRPYANVSDTPGLQSEIRRLEELRLQAVELRVEAELAAGNHRKVIPELEALVADHPLRERFRFQQMLALHRSGRQPEALRAFQQTVDYLAHETGLEPSPELRDLEMRILQQDDSLLAGVGEVVTQRRAFLFTEIEGSARLWDSQPDAMGRAVQRCDEIIDNSVLTAGGRVFKRTGEGVMAAFSSVVEAVRAAENAQRTVQSEDWDPLDGIRIRMGIDVGEADARGDDFFGPPLNRSARITTAAHGGQVLLSLAAQEELTRTPTQGVQVRYLGEHRLRGLSDAERIGQLVFLGLPADFPELRTHVPMPSLDDPTFGDSVRGYELREQLGVGTFGAVYRAYQPSVGREVALKVIRPEYANHPAFVRRFEAEARLVARLEHPHIVPMFDFWRDQTGAYVAMQLIAGGTAQSLIDTPWALPDAVGVIRQVGSALASAHRRGIVHRDLAPENVLLDEDGNAYLADFGIAARIMEPTDSAPPSQSAMRYRAPEAVLGEAASHRSDIFSLGVLTFELLTAKRFDGPNQTVSGVRPGLPAALDGVVARATASDPADRHDSADAFLDGLADALGDLVELGADVVTRTAIRNPYKGLRPFSEADSADFFGRDDLVDDLEAAVMRRPIVAVVGPSGSGKSSVVRAGLIPRLTFGADEWLYAAFTPGAHPFAALAKALESVATEPLPDLADRLAESPTALVDAASQILEAHAGELVLAVDQFEEVFTHVEHESEREAFLQLIATTAEADRARVRFVLTLRADFYDRPLSYEHIGPHVMAGQLTVIAPSRRDLIEAIERPALAVGLRFEPGLAARIAADVAEQPGGLPLMQYALTELFEARSADLLTTEDYEGIGGVVGALGKRAEQVYSELSSSRQEAAQRILLRLVTVDEGADDTRRRAKRSELHALDLDPQAVAEVVAAFDRHRLLSFDRDAATRTPTVEVAHEALLREWPRFAGWIEDERGSLVLARRFRSAMSEWERAGQADDYLLTGERLAPFTELGTHGPLTGEEQAFLTSSKQAEERRRGVRRRRRRVLTGVLAGAAAISIAFGAFGLVQRGQAENNAREAERQALLADENADEALQNAARADESAVLAEERAAEAESAAALASARELAAAAINVLERDPQLAILLTLEAIEAAPAGDAQPAEVINALWQANQANRLVGFIEPGYGGSVAIDLSRDGSRLAVLSPEGASVQLHEPATDEMLWEYKEDTADSIDYVAIRPDGSLVAAAVVDSESRWASRQSGEVDELPSRVLIIDGETGELVQRLDYPECPGLYMPAWSADGSVVTVAPTPDGCPRSDAPSGYWVEVLDAETWEPLALLPLDGPIRGIRVEFDDAGNLYVFDPGFSPVVYDDEFKLVGTLDGAFGLGDVAPDGEHFVVGHLEEFYFGIYDAETGEQVDSLKPANVTAAFPLGLSYSDDGRFVIAANDGTDTLVWDSRTGELVHSLPGGASSSAVFDPASERIYTSGPGRVSIWNTGPGFPGVETTGDLGATTWINSNSFGIGPEFGTAIAIDPNVVKGDVRFFDLDTGQLLETPTSGNTQRDPRGSAAVALGDGVFVFETSDGPWIGYNTATGEEWHLIGCWEDEDNFCIDTGEAPVYYELRASSDSSELVAVSNDARILVLDPMTGAVLSESPAPAGTDFLFAVSSEWLLTGRDGEEVYALDRSSGNELWALASIRKFEVSPSGETAAFQVPDGTIRVLALGTWDEASVDVPFGRIRGIGFSPDDGRLAIGDESNLHIVDVGEGVVLQSIPLPGVSDIYWIDSETIVFATNNGVWATLSLDPADLVAASRASLARELTSQECLTYRIDGCSG